MKTIPLTIDFGDASPEHPYPVRGGVPFAQGVLDSTDHLQLLSEEGERECQVSCTATWPDGSIKWALIDCIGSADESLTLAFGTGVTRKVPRSGLHTTQDCETVRIDTGVLQVVIRRDGTGFLDEIIWNGNAMVVDSEGERRHLVDYIHVERTENRPANTMVVSGTDDPSRHRIEKLIVEEDGPLHAVVLIRGRFVYQHVGTTIPELTGPLSCPFTIRCRFWRDSGLVGVEHFFYYEGDPDHDFIRRIGLGMTLASVDDDGTTTFGDYDGTDRTVPADRTSGLHQATYNHYHLWQTNEDDTPETTHTGQRAAGWVDISNNTDGVAFGIRSFPQQFEKALHVDGKTGRIDAWLWPPEAQTLDMRRYAREWGVGEGGYNETPFPVNYRLAAKGAGKSHELLFYFHEGDTHTADVSEVFKAFDTRPLLLAQPSYYAETRVFGQYHAADSDHFKDLEQIIQRPIDYLAAAQEQSQWYGFFDYGDVQTCYATFHKHDRWESDFGRWGWGNGDQVGRLNYALMLQFIRTLDRKNFAFAEANMFHVHDVDTTHTTAYPFEMEKEFRDLSGSAHRHNAQHWACNYVGSRGAHPVGARIHYFLTGSGRSKDILDDILTLAERIPGGAANDGHGTSAISFLCAWERTGEVAYRDKALQCLEDYDIDRIRGGWLAMISAAFGVFDAMVEYTDLTGDDRFISNILDFAAMCMGPEIEDNWTYPGGYFRIYAEALRYGTMAGDNSFDQESFIQGIDRARKRLNEQMAASAPYLPGDQWPAPPGESAGAFPNFSIDANTLRDLPYLMGSLMALGREVQRPLSL